MGNIATFSFDDGGPADFPMIDLFSAEGITPTMYVLSSLVTSDEMIYGMDRHRLREAYVRAEVGSHTVSHPHLSLASEEATRFELANSKAVLEERLERPVTLFAHPYGSSGGQTERILEECGYQWARRIHRSCQKPTDHRFRMPIDVMFHSAEEETLLFDLIERQENVHVLCHSWWIVRQGMEEQLRGWIRRLSSAGYEILPNSRYFELTLQSP